jgi:hypothetical protein
MKILAPSLTSRDTNFIYCKIYVFIFDTGGVLKIGFCAISIVCSSSFSPPYVQILDPPLPPRRSGWSTP